MTTSVAAANNTVPLQGLWAEWRQRVLLLISADFRELLGERVTVQPRVRPDGMQRMGNHGRASNRIL